MKVNLIIEPINRRLGLEYKHIVSLQSLTINAIVYLWPHRVCFQLIHSIRQVVYSA